jgi:phage-related protein
MPEKELVWLGSSRAEIRSFPADARRIAGFQLYRVQCGLDPNDWKPMSSVGPGVREVRVHAGAEHRVIYLARFSDRVYVLHAFQKRSRKTPRHALDVARQRLRSLLLERGKVEQ